MELEIDFRVWCGEKLGKEWMDFRVGEVRMRVNGRVEDRLERREKGGRGVGTEGDEEGFFEVGEGSLYSYRFLGRRVCRVEELRVF